MRMCWRDVLPVFYSISKMVIVRIGTCSHRRDSLVKISIMNGQGVLAAAQIKALVLADCSSPAG